MKKMMHMIFSFSLSFLIFASNICLAARNLANVKIVLPSEVNTFDVVSCDNLLITEEALKSLEEVLK